MSDKKITMPKGMTPDGMRDEQSRKDNATRAWASACAAGTQPPTFAEVSRAPVKSPKNIKR